MQKEYSKKCCCFCDVKKGTQIITISQIITMLPLFIFLFLYEDINFTIEDTTIVLKTGVRTNLLVMLGIQLVSIVFLCIGTIKGNYVFLLIWITIAISNYSVLLTKILIVVGHLVQNWYETIYAGIFIIVVSIILFYTIAVVYIYYIDLKKEKGGVRGKVKQEMSV